jgi:hypothetical protein
MPAGVAPAGRATGELGSSVRLPLLTANAPTESTRLSFTYRYRPPGLRPGSTAPTPAVAETVVLPSSVSSPPGAMAYREMAPDDDGQLNLAL